ncbi:MAG: glycosyltransferase family 2 protein [Halanaeroarchaeum sp.]
MDLSVVVPTLNARDRVVASLDALAEHAPDAEVVVVNGPSSDGTTGAVRDHPAADALLELSERNLNSARNAGIAAADGDVIALVGQDSRIREGWTAAIADAMASDVAVATGPVHRRVSGGVTTEEPETATIGSRSVTYFDGGNVAFTADVLETLDGFDQYLHTGAARDLAHRLAAIGAAVAWRPEMVVLREEEDDVVHRVGEDDPQTVLGLKYRSMAYRLAKNYGLAVRPGYRLIRHAVLEAASEGWDVLRGEADVSTWLSTGRSFAENATRGLREGLAARAADEPPRRNPHGVTARSQSPISTYSL